MARKGKTNDLMDTYSDIILSGTAKNTRKAYLRDLRYFWAWAKARLGHRRHYPVAEKVIIQFIIDHIQQMPKDIEDQLIASDAKTHRGPIKVTTMRRYLCSLSIAHQEASKPNPVTNDGIKLLMRRARRAWAVEQAPQKKAAITKEILTDLLATCDDSLTGVRDRAILLVGFTSGGRRRSELAHLRVDHLARVDGGYVMRVARSKTDQDGQGYTVPVLGQAAKALTSWLMKSGIRSGYVFRGIKKNGALNDAICGRTINRMIKRRIKQIGLDPDLYGGHSLRSGFITSAAREGTHVYDAMSLSGHRSIEIANGYYRESELLANPASRLFDQGFDDGFDQGLDDTLNVDDTDTITNQ